MANNEIIVSVIARINAQDGISFEMKSKAIAEVLAFPDRAESIMEVLLDLEAEGADMEAYCDGNGIEDNRRREMERRAAEETAKKQAEEHENKLRNAAAFNVMSSKNPPVFGSDAFCAAFQAEYKRLKDGKSVVFDPAGGAFVYDMEANNMTEHQRAIVEAENRKAQTSDAVIGEYMTALPDGKHHFKVVDVRERADSNSGLLRQTLTLEETSTGYPAYLSWLIDKDVDHKDYAKTRIANLVKYNKENGNCFHGLTETQAMEKLIADGVDAYTITYANAAKRGDQRLPSVILSEADFHYRYTHVSTKALYNAEREALSHETKAQTYKF